MDMKWPSAAPKTRDGITDALAAVIPALVYERLPDGLEVAILRSALRHFALPPSSRDLVRPPDEASALRWLEKASLPVSEIGKPQHARAALDAISVRQDGRAASATTIARKRSVFANVLRYAIEPGELPSSPLARLSWKPPKVSEVVDRRVVVNPRQARERPRRAQCRGLAPGLRQVPGRRRPGRQHAHRRRAEGCLMLVAG